MIVRSQNSQSRTMFSLRFRRNHLWPLGTDRLLRPGRGAGFRRGVQFSKRLNFEGKFGKCTECEGVEILRHRTGFLYKSCQTVLRLKQIPVPSKEDKKMHFGGSLSPTKCYPYKAGPRNLSAISPTRNVTYMYALNFSHYILVFLC